MKRDARIPFYCAAQRGGMLQSKTSAKGSSAEKLRSPFLQKGRDAFLSVVGRNDPGESSLLDRESIVYCGVHSAMDCRERCGKRQRRLGRRAAALVARQLNLMKLHSISAALDIGCAEPTCQASFLGRASEFLMRKFRFEFSREWCNSGSTDAGSAGAPYHP